MQKDKGKEVIEDVFPSQLNDVFSKVIQDREVIIAFQNSLIRQIGECSKVDENKGNDVIEGGVVNGKTWRAVLFQPQEVFNDNWCMECKGFNLAQRRKDVLLWCNKRKIELFAILEPRIKEVNLLDAMSIFNEEWQWISAESGGKSRIIVIWRKGKVIVFPSITDF